MNWKAGGKEICQSHLPDFAEGFTCSFHISWELQVQSAHRGLGTERHPMSAVWLYNHKLPQENTVPYQIEKGWVSFIQFQNSQNVLVVYLNNVSVFDSVRNVFPTLPSCFFVFPLDALRVKLCDGTILILGTVKIRCAKQPMSLYGHGAFGPTFLSVK